MDELQEIPVASLEQTDAPPPCPKIEADPPEAPVEKSAVPKKTGRPKGVRDKAPRAKRHAKPVERPVQMVSVASTSRVVEPPPSQDDSSDSDNSLDAEAMRRAMRYMSKKQATVVSKRQQQYASWFGR